MHNALLHALSHLLISPAQYHMPSGIHEAMQVCRALFSPDVDPFGSLVYILLAYIYTSITVHKE